MREGMKSWSTAGMQLFQVQKGMLLAEVMLPEVSGGYARSE